MLRIRQLLFCPSSHINDLTNVDFCAIHSSEHFVRDIPNSKVYLQYTFINDLTSDEDSIFSNFSKTNQNEIRRCEKENVSYQCFFDFDRDVVRDFCKTYNNMFRIKKMNKRFNKSLIIAALKNKKMVITKASCENNQKCFVYHAYFYDGINSDLLYSASPVWKNSSNKEDRNLIGRMNKGLHFYDMKILKKEGIEKYDWGGIGNTPDVLSGIGKFKQSFGGEIACFANYFSARSGLGKMLFSLLKVLKKV